MTKEIKKAVTSEALADEESVAPQAPIEEPKTELKVEEGQVANQEPQAAKEAKFAPGLFSDWRLGATLVQSPSGNKIINTKPSK